MDESVDIAIGNLNTQATCSSNLWEVSSYNVSSLTGSTVTITADLSDAAGNPATQASTTVNRDVVAPLVAFTSTNFEITSANHNGYSLEGTCDAIFSVKLTIGSLPSETLNCANGGTWTLTNKDVSTLSDGNSITLRVEQKDDLENIGFAEEVIVKDTVHPAPTLTTTTASLFVNASNEGSYSLQGGCDGSEDVSVTLGTQNAESTACSSGQWSYSVSSSLSEDSYVLTISQEDALGNEGVLSPSPTLVKDTTLPTVALASDQDIDASNATNYRPQGTCNEEGTVTVTVGNLTPATAPCNGNLWQLNPGVNASGLSDATSISITLSIEDLAGNTFSTTDTVIKNIANRAVTINTSAIINIANESSYTVTGTCSNHSGAMSLTVGGLSPSVEPTCSVGTWSASVNVSSLSDGNSITINISFGEGSNQATDFATISKDTQNPTVGISTSPAVNQINQNSYDLSGTCSENERNVDIAIGSLNTQATCSSNLWEVSSYNVSSSTGSTVTITADLSDAAGNPATQATATVDRDVVAPLGSFYFYQL